MRNINYNSPSRSFLPSTARNSIILPRAKYYIIRYTDAVITIKC